MENVKYIPGDLVKLKYNGKVYHISKIIPSIYDDIIRIQSVEDGCLCVEYKDKIKENIEGVPLTPQILEANGWKEVPLAKGHYVRQQGISIFKNINGEGFLAQHEIGITINLDFVHQLQHLLFGLGLDSSLKV